MSDYDQEKKDGEQGWMQRIQESPRTVTVLLIILIAAAAIYAFSGDRPAPGEEAPTDEDVTEEQAEEEGDTTGIEDGEEVAEEEGTAAPELPPAERIEEGFVETAQSGEGITHLARRAASQYLSENNAGYEVTKEHSVFIEDYVQNQLGTRGLALGEQMTITNDLIAQAVEAAGQLSENQLKNLSQYTSALP
ncbi:MAG: hypothetical protein HYR90_01890 [Candidatus Andersenbacteria bacterium]|nr:hypothetical protein [Candidatus Andersenbacteria bacterium]MBI3250912.1 hypothetical protein [Candidatus Andersenbacteria bacterium]